MIQRLKGIQTEFATEKMHLPVPKSYSLSASSTISNCEQSLTFPATSVLQWKRNVKNH